MKRIASFVLAVLLILSLCACSLPQAKPAKEPTDELELVEEAAETAEAEAPEERPIMPEETAPEASEPEALPPEKTEPAAEAAAEGTETPAEVLPEEPAAPEEAPIPDAPSEVQTENAEAAEMPEPEEKAPSGNGTAPAGDVSGGEFILVPHVDERGVLGGFQRVQAGVYVQSGQLFGKIHDLTILSYRALIFRAALRSRRAGGSQWPARQCRRS